MVMKNVTKILNFANTIVGSKMGFLWQKLKFGQQSKRGLKLQQRYLFEL